MNKKMVCAFLAVLSLSSCTSYQGSKIPVPYQEEGGLVSYSTDALMKDYPSQTLVVLLSLKNSVPCACVDDKDALDEYAKKQHFYIYDLTLDYDEENFFTDYERIVSSTSGETSLHLPPIETDEDGNHHLPLFPVLMVYYTGIVGVLKTEDFISSLKDYVITETVSLQS